MEIVCDHWRSRRERAILPRTRLESWTRIELCAYLQYQLDHGESVTAALRKEMFKETFALDVTEDLIRFESPIMGWEYCQAKVVDRDKKSHSKQIVKFGTRIAVAGRQEKTKSGENCSRV